MIQQLETLGPLYFELSSVTRITPDQFRQIADAVTEWFTVDWHRARGIG